MAKNKNAGGTATAPPALPLPTLELPALDSLPDDPGEEMDAALSAANGSPIVTDHTAEFKPPAAKPKAAPLPQAAGVPNADEPPPAPKVELPAVEPHVPTGEPFDGIAPMVGMPVWFWQEAHGRLEPLPGVLMERSSTNEWTLNVQIVGGISVRSARPYSSTPQRGCWSWPDWIKR